MTWLLLAAAITAADMGAPEVGDSNRVTSCVQQAFPASFYRVRDVWCEDINHRRVHLVVVPDETADERVERLETELRMAKAERAVNASIDRAKRRRGAR